MVGVPGMDNQSLGLARELVSQTGMRVVEKRIHFVWPWRHLPPELWLRPLDCLGPGSDPLEPPWPDVVIGTGRLTMAPGAAIRRESGGRSFSIHIHHPGWCRRGFDLVLLPEHDRLRADNVLTYRGGLNVPSAELLQFARTRFEGRFSNLPRPRIAVLLGGNNRCYAMTPDWAHSLGVQLRSLARRDGASLLVTPSRRTDQAAMAALRGGLADAPAFVWDGSGDNPYLGLLAWADSFVVTADSTNMVSEACSTGRPVLVAQMPGGSGKFLEFHRQMRSTGYTRDFCGSLEHWTYVPLNDVTRVARQVLRRMDARGPGT
jgi:mitochondrial fission protein ELM1